MVTNSKEGNTMNWIDIAHEMPVKYEEVIIASNDGTVKSATHIGGGKFTTYLTVTHWMHMPEPPKVEQCTEVAEEQPVKKKRGRPKKS